MPRYSQKFVELISRMTKHNPQDRPDFETVVLDVIYILDNEKNSKPFLRPINKEIQSSTHSNNNDDLYLITKKVMDLNKSQ